MTGLAALFLAVGAADLVRGAGSRRARLVRACLTGVLTIVVVLVLGDLGTPGDLGLLALAAAAMTGWVLLSESSLDRDTGHLLPLAVLGGAIALSAALSGLAGPVQGPLETWLGWITVPDVADVAPERVLLLAGLLLVQVATANLVVRHVLSHVGAIRPPGQSQPSDRLKGGRLLGPMERVFIVGLGLAGYLTAAGLVIAAKSLIRFPELQSRRSEESGVGIHEVTEYFLVGSFLSWLLAVSALAVSRLS